LGGGGSGGAPERGRIKIRGHNVFVGYYGDGKLTDAKIDAEGWLTTNDIGQWNPNGTLTVLGHEQGILQPVKGQIVLYTAPPPFPSSSSSSSSTIDRSRVC
jgi:long-subunit acyl-CoA synthetase (AMP-forming)